MRVAIIGGAGTVGQAVALGLIRAETVTDIVLVDVHDDPGALCLRLRKNAKVSQRRLDARDQQALVAALAGTCLLVNCAGPFCDTVVPVARAAVALGADSLDVCDDFAATALLLESDLDAAAQAAGVSLITGMGADPGTNNLLALWYAKKLDTVQSVSLAWAVDCGDLAGAALAHAATMLAGEVPQFCDGRLHYLEGGAGEETVTFADPIGTVTVRYVGHPQPLTLPRRLPGLQNLTVKGVILPDWADRMLMAQKSNGLLRREPLALAASLLRERASAMPPGPGVSGLKVAVSGTRQGRAVTYAAEMVGAMGLGTGLPAAIAALLLLEGSVAAKGLLAPEDAIDPQIFVARLLACGAAIRQTRSETVTLTADGGSV
ncbi:MAG: saccharopine dehydrogenase-like oxidoreductase [Solidesulfovibrio magneticus str. Maddingley MBC34]|uniref:Saccharopine dehydrogenase-like oxidoreductase n=1 Tax=Solidesulfovibrio magneticus str. Maddingley MBC34 TaxID=1206767 RepID=K6H692_9BACT|nr:MAG: saccharopine dehydrogenase-like oxidoreductase [Solidesulfovibrio magneticus str. Maddingley MBC34]